jgi:hypothetical protein
MKQLTRFICLAPLPLNARVSKKRGQPFRKENSGSRIAEPKGVLFSHVQTPVHSDSSSGFALHPSGIFPDLPRIQACGSFFHLSVTTAPSGSLLDPVTPASVLLVVTRRVQDVWTCVGKGAGLPSVEPAPYWVGGMGMPKLAVTVTGPFIVTVVTGAEPAAPPLQLWNCRRVTT